MNLYEVDIALLISLLISVGTFIWRIATVKGEIFKEIQRSNNSLKNDLYKISADLEKISLQNKNDHEHLEYIDHSLKETLQHKCSRLEDWINQICDHLEDKDDFAINRSILRRRRDK